MSTKNHQEIQKNAAEMERQLQFLCDSLGFSFTEIRQELKAKWMLEDMSVAQAAADAAQLQSPERLCLERALACMRANDAAGARQAGLDWLKTKHGAQLGDTITLWGWKKPRVVELRDIEVVIENDDVDECYIEFIGPCISQRINTSSPERHLQPHYVKVSKKS